MSSDRVAPVFTCIRPNLSAAGPDFQSEAIRLAGINPDEVAAAVKPKKGRGKRSSIDVEVTLEAERALEAEAAERKKAIDAQLDYLYEQALSVPGFSLELAIKATHRRAEFVPGHAFGSDNLGPVPARVMVVGKQPGIDEVRELTYFSGPASQSLFRAFDDLGMTPDDYNDWYATCLIKHANVNPSGGAARPAWFRNCLPLFELELDRVRPDFILCLGSEASVALLGDGRTVTATQSESYQYEYKIGPDFSESRTATVCTAASPAFSYMQPETYDDFLRSIRFFKSVIDGRDGVDDSIGLHHEVVYTERRLAAIVDMILSEPDNNVIALDCEWHGERYEEPGAYLRTIQFSHRAKHAYVIPLRGKGGKPMFRPGPSAALSHLTRLCKSTPERKVRIGGHFLRADLPWLCSYGLDLRPEFDAPDTPEATVSEGGWDTAYMMHAVHESLPSFGLEVLTARLTDIPRYDVPIEKEVQKLCEQRGVTLKALGGYGDLEDSDEFFTYACYDVDGPRRMFDRFNGVNGEPGLLDRDRYGNSSRTAFWHSQIAALSFLEMEMTGVRFDRARAESISELFISTRNALRSELESEIGWPGFNPGSINSCRELLFGEALNGTVTPDGTPKRLRPEGAITLGLVPIKAAGKRAPSWENVVEDGDQDVYNACTDKEVLGILGHENPIALKLRNIRFLDQVLKNPLRTPAVDANGNLLIPPVDPNADPDDPPPRFVYKGGIFPFEHSDHRIRTHFLPVDTGRCSSSRPNLQAISKTREETYSEIIGDRHTHPVRSILRASKGKVMLEVDLQSAEVAALAWLSGDFAMMEDVRISMLPKSHPDYADIHSKTAVSAFRLDCPPTKKGLESIGKGSLRTAAKNVRFGVPYGRGAESLLRQCLETGAHVTIQDMESLLTDYALRYPQAMTYLKACEDRVDNQGWLASSARRYRRLGVPQDEKRAKDMKRQARNFPVQSIVADAINLACRNLYRYRAEHVGPETFTFLLQIHDALLFELDPAHVPWLAKTVLPLCMTERVPIYPCDLDGNRIGTGPYHFGIDVSAGDVFSAWGEPITLEEGARIGLDPEFCK